MKLRIKLLSLVIGALLLCNATLAQGTMKFPIVLIQNLQTAPSTIVVGNDFNITVESDTANYIDIITNGTIEEADSMRFPATKLQLKNNGTLLSFEKDFPFHSGIRVHTTASDITIDARGDAHIEMTSYNRQAIKLNRLSLAAANNAIIVVNPDVNAEEANMEVKGYGWIRYRHIHAPRTNKQMYGAGRLSHFDGETEESAISALIADHDAMPLFMDWAIGAGSVIQSYGNANTATNFTWSTSFNFDFSGRYAFLHKRHWDLSTGFGVHTLSLVADNAYLQVQTDPATGKSNLVAADASALFAQEESNNGKIVWSSSTSVGYIYVPIRIEWRKRSDYKGVSLSAELQPGFNYMRRVSYMHHRGVYQNSSKIAYTCDEDFGKYLNPFMLGARLTVGWKYVNAYLEGSLTPLLRTNHSGNNRAIGEKMYPFSYGICFTF